MRDPFNDLRMRLKEALDNLWSRITSRFSTVDERVDDIDDAIDSVESSLNGVIFRVTGVEGRMTTAEGAINTVSGRVDDLEGGMIKSISFNGTNVPKDAQGNVALQETDPNVPAWAKQQKAKTSDLTNDGDGTDNNSPFATEAYVAANGGKIDEVQVNGTPLPIVNKVVDVPVPTKTSDLLNDSGFSNMETLHMTSAAWSYVDYIFSQLESELSSYEIRPFIASNVTISVITNQQISPSLWGFVYTWRDQWHNYRFAGVDNVNGDIYIIEVHTDQTHYEQNIVYVDEIYKIDGGGGGGGGGGGSINGIYFNGTLIGIDTEGYVHLDESDPNVQTWAKAQNPPTYTAADVGAIPTTSKGAASGVAELDASGHVPTSQLPSYVDDVLEYAQKSAFPAIGETGKIYVAKDTNLTYRWTGSAYTEISPSLALGETSSTAYRGDRGKTAYDHAQAKGSAYASGLYLIQTNSEGHVIAATPVAKADITALGIPAQDTTYSPATQSTAGLMSSSDKSKLDGIASGAQVNSVTGVKGNAESSYRTGNVNITPANIGAVNKSGDRINGSIALETAATRGDLIGFGTIAGQNSDYISIDQHNWGLIYYRLPVINVSDSTLLPSNFRFFEYSPNADGTYSDHAEMYNLPTVNVGRTSDIQYDILTSKNAVTVSQGGTGATTAANARTNLGVGLVGSYIIAKDPDFSADPFAVRLYVYNGFAIISCNIWTDIGEKSEITMFDLSDYIQPVEKTLHVFPGQNMSNNLLVTIYSDGHVTGYKTDTGNTFYRGTVTIPIIEQTD